MRSASIVEEQVAAGLIEVLLILADVEPVLEANGQPMSRRELTERGRVGTEPGAAAVVDVDRAGRIRIVARVAHVVDEAMERVARATESAVVAGIHPAARIRCLEARIAEGCLPGGCRHVLGPRGIRTLERQGAKSSAREHRKVLVGVEVDGTTEVRRRIIELGIEQVVDAGALVAGGRDEDVPLVP